LIEDPEIDREQKVLMRLETSPRHPTPQNQPGNRLAPGIEAMSMRFFNGIDWQETWDSSGEGLPQLVEITMRIWAGETIVPFRSAFDLTVIQAH
jgi:hypothetical protein